MFFMNAPLNSLLRTSDMTKSPLDRFTISSQEESEGATPGAGGGGAAGERQVRRGAREEVRVE
jgi:hypothetical protein